MDNSKILKEELAELTTLEEAGYGEQFISTILESYDEKNLSEAMTFEEFKHRVKEIMDSPDDEEQ